MNTRHLSLSLCLSVLVFLSLSGCGALKIGPSPQTTYESATLALTNGTLIDGTGADPLAGAIVLLGGDKILAVGAADSVEVPAGVTTVDLGGATILPGFINAHVHRGFNKANLEAWAQGGVTTVRDEGTSSAQLANLKAFQAELSADPNYARLVSAGVMLAVPGGYGDLYVNSADEARQAVLTEVEQGVDAIKVAMEDGYAGTSGLPKLTPEELKAIVTAAHEKGLPVSGHITQGAYIQPLLDAGVDDIAHLAYDFINPDTLKQMVEQDIVWIPTFTVFRNYGAPVTALKDNLRQFLELGGKVALGNDYGGGTGEFEMGLPMYEIQMMSQSGMTPMQVILAGTKNAAHALRLDAEIGSIEPGKSADILIVDGNPLDDLQVLAKVKMVIHNGTIIRDEIRE
jgi:imidazolonepropionase-like amidohydrolase